MATHFAVHFGANLDGAGNHAIVGGEVSLGDVGAISHASGVVATRALTATAIGIRKTSSGDAIDLKLIVDGAASAAVEFTDSTSPVVVESLSISIAAGDEWGVEIDDFGASPPGSTTITVFGTDETNGNGSNMVGAAWGASLSADNYLKVGGRSGTTSVATDLVATNYVWPGADNSVLQALGIYGTSTATDTDWRVYVDGVSVLDVATETSGEYSSNALSVDIDQGDRIGIKTDGGTTPGESTAWAGIVPA